MFTLTTEIYGKGTLYHKFEKFGAAVIIAKHTVEALDLVMDLTRMDMGLKTVHTDEYYADHYTELFIEIKKSEK